MHRNTKPNHLIFNKSNQILNLNSTPLGRLHLRQRLKPPNQPHSTSRSQTTRNDHLKGSRERLPHIHRPLPTTHDPGLRVAKHEQRNDHGSNGPAQGDEGITRSDEEVGQEGDEAAEEVAEGDSQGADEGARAGRLLERVVEVHEEGVEFGGCGEVLG